MYSYGARTHPTLHFSLGVFRLFCLWSALCGDDAASVGDGERRLSVGWGLFGTPRLTLRSCFILAAALWRLLSSLHRVAVLVSLAESGYFCARFLCAALRQARWFALRDCALLLLLYLTTTKPAILQQALLLTNSPTGLHFRQEVCTNCEYDARRWLLDFRCWLGVGWAQAPGEARVLGHSLAEEHIRARSRTYWVLRIVGRSAHCHSHALCKCAWWEACGPVEHCQLELADFSARIPIYTQKSQVSSSPDQSQKFHLPWWSETKNTFLKLL